MSEWETKDSGARQEYDSGMRRDLQDGKPGHHYLYIDGIPYEEQFLTRCAALMSRGAAKYGAKNFQLAESEEELERFKASAARHFAQWICGETDEDHGAATYFNIMAAEMVKWKRAHLTEPPTDGTVALHDDEEDDDDATVQSGGQLRIELQDSSGASTDWLRALGGGIRSRKR